MKKHLFSKVAKRSVYGFSELLFAPLVAVACVDPEDNETGVDDSDGDITAEESGGVTAGAEAEGASGDSADTSDPTSPQGCIDGEDENSPRVALDAEISTDTLLTCDTVWVLTGETFVRGATLTLEPGTTVLGQNGSALVIGTDARIEAAGTADAPIVFTSSQPIGQRARQDWGGLVLLGLAEVNLPTGVGVAEGFADPPQYGGTDRAHDCGTLQYVRVEWAGFELVADNELNAVTFYACGTGTTVDHVQAHMGSDDGFEAFGGGFDAKYLVVTGQADDAFDFDLGFVGTVQYALVHQDPSEPDGNHGLEWSNGPDNFTATPLTSPWIANLTFIGQGPDGNAGKSIGFVIKQGAGAHIYNSYFTAVSGPGATFQDEATLTVAMNDGLVIEGTLWGTKGAFGHQGDGPYSWSDAEWTAFVMNQPNNGEDVDLGLDITWTAPKLKPASDGPAAHAGVAFSHPSLETTSFVGAVDPDGDDWTAASWINYEVE